MNLYHKRLKKDSYDRGAAVEVDALDPLRVGVAAFIGLIVLTILFVALGSGFSAYSRYQDRANRNQTRQQRIYDEQNAIQVNKIRIAQQDQLVKVAQQKAQIRYENAVGVRKAQDEISHTLTPLYVQFEMVQALQAIAQSGKNNTVVYIPSGANGIPLVSTTDPLKVGQP